MPARSLTVRALDLEDVAFAVETVRAVQPAHPWHQEELLSFWRMTERVGGLRRLLIEVDGRPAGWACAAKRRGSPEENARLMVFLPGAGAEELDRAWAVAESAACDLGASLGRASVWEDQPAVLEVLRARAWEWKRRERFWRLELAGQRGRLVSLRDEARRRVEAAGVRVVTAADLGGEAVFPALHQISETTSMDIPRSLPHVPMPYAEWLEWMRPPAVFPERLWVGASGGRPVGLSYLDYRSTPVATAYTGVLKEARGRGVARALKLETLVQAIDLGVDAVETDNDSENAPILRLNEELGYREIPGQAQLHKRLTHPR